jgi:PadR family transcriptional regulator PadR
VPRRPDRSPQTVAVLDALAGDASDLATWRHGYDVARRTGLASGTLYPILARLADRGYLERRWEVDPPPGRPARHLYRLTAIGQQLHADLQAEHHPPPESSRRSRPSHPAPSRGPAVGLG